jgi:predicted enzyme related to lactoylglutathione lyase
MKLEPFLYVTNLRTSMKFYHDLLGFTVGELHPDEYNPTFAPLFTDGYKLMLEEVEVELPAYHKHGACGSGIQLFLEVPNADEIYDRLKGCTQVVDQIANRPWGRTFSISDPDGYIVSFYSSI